MADLLTRRLQQRVAILGDRAATLTGQHWKDLPGYDEADIATFARTAGPTLNGLKVAAVSTGAAFYAYRHRLRPVAVQATQVPVDPYYREPFIAFWNALAHGVPGDEAVLSGVARAEAMARNLAVSAARLAGPVVFARTGREPRHWIREADGGACDFCIDAANDVYSSAEAADFGHDRCGCSVDAEF